MCVKPIIFVFGPSGVGKSYLLTMLKKKKFLCMPIDTDDTKKYFRAYGVPKEWDDDYHHHVEFAQLADCLRDRLGDKHAGAIVSFPTVYVFTPDKLVKIAQHGVIPLVLWGKPQDCIRAAEKRINEKGKPFNLSRYEEMNKDTFRAYGCPEYDAFRVDAFREDSLRHPGDEWLAQIMERVRLANNDIQTGTAEPCR